MNTSAVIEVQNLSHTYTQGSASALRGITFAVKSGEIFGFLGPNGGGKTTLFRILATLLAPSDGTAKIFGADVTKQPYLVRSRIGVVFQSQSLDKKLTVGENLRHQGHLYGLRGRALRKRIDQLLLQFSLVEQCRQPVETLSGGMKRRVELCKAFLHRPELLLMDEPTTGLDPGARLSFWEYLERLRDEDGVTILLTTHFMDEAEKCHRLGILNRGQLVAMDTPEVLKGQVRGDVVVLRTRDPKALSLEIEKRFQAYPTVVDNTVRIERPHGHEFVAKLMEAFPGRIEAVSLSKPTLEDVFIHQTGTPFWFEGSQAGAAEHSKRG